MNEMEIFEEEIEIYNSKMKLMKWLYQELKYHPENLRKDMMEVKGRLSLNI